MACCFVIFFFFRHFFSQANEPETERLHAAQFERIGQQIGGGGGGGGNGGGGVVVGGGDVGDQRRPLVALSTPSVAQSAQHHGPCRPLDDSMKLLWCKKKNKKKQRMES